MGDWDRSTRKLALEDIRPEIAGAIQEHITFYNLGPILDDALIRIETVSDKKKRGLFRRGLFDLMFREKQRIEVAIVTPRWLVLVTRGEKPDSVAALSVPLEDATVTDHADHPAYQRLPDTGLHVTGAFTGRVGMHGSQRVSVFIGLGEEAAAREFKEILFQAIKETRL